MPGWEKPYSLYQTEIYCLSRFMYFNITRYKYPIMNDCGMAQAILRRVSNFLVDVSSLLLMRNKWSFHVVNNWNRVERELLLITILCSWLLTTSGNGGRHELLKRGHSTLSWFSLYYEPFILMELNPTRRTLNCAFDFLTSVYPSLTGSVSRGMFDCFLPHFGKIILCPRELVWLMLAYRVNVTDINIISAIGSFITKKALFHQQSDQ